MSLDIENLTVSYGDTRALNSVSVRLEPGELFFLLGPSGCGKSTLLRCVAGFIEDFGGEIRFQGQSLKGVPPHKRDFGMVFQNYALFPHLTVEGNVAFGLEARRVPGPERKTRVVDALKMVGLDGYQQRRPGELSGGQQQRVALARALVIRPRLLLLDEPLSNLDARLRWEMREEIRRIHHLTGITTLYVTHDQNEALSLANRLAIMRNGVIDALGPPRKLYRHPPTRFSAEFLGEINAHEGVLRHTSGHGAGDWSVETEAGEIPLSHDAVSTKMTPGERVLVFCRPEDVLLTSQTEGLPSGHLMLDYGRVLSSAYLGETTLYQIERPETPIWHVRRREAGLAPFADGQTVRIGVRSGAWAVVPI